MFEEYIDKNVKILFKDGIRSKIARGNIIEVDENHIKISGIKGILIINKKNIEKVGLIK